MEKWEAYETHVGTRLCPHWLQFDGEEEMGFGEFLGRLNSPNWSQLVIN